MPPAAPAASACLRLSPRSKFKCGDPSYPRTCYMPLVLLHFWHILAQSRPISGMICPSPWRMSLMPTSTAAGWETQSETRFFSPPGPADRSKDPSASSKKCKERWVRFLLAFDNLLSLGAQKNATMRNVQTDSWIVLVSLVRLDWIDGFCYLRIQNAGKNKAQDVGRELLVHQVAGLSGSFWLHCSCFHKPIWIYLDGINLNTLNPIERYYDPLGMGWTIETCSKSSNHKKNIQKPPTVATIRIIMNRENQIYPDLSSWS